MGEAYVNDLNSESVRMSQWMHTRGSKVTILIYRYDATAPKTNGEPGAVPYGFSILGPARVTEVGSLSTSAKMAVQIFVRCIFAIFATDASFLRVIANLQS